MLWHVVVPLDAVSEDSDCHFDEKTWLHVDLGRSMKAYGSLLHIVERMESWARCVSGMSGLSSAMLTLLDPCRNLYQFLGDSSLFIGIYIILYHFIFCFMILNYVKLYYMLLVVMLIILYPPPVHASHSLASIKNSSQQRRCRLHEGLVWRPNQGRLDSNDHHLHIIPASVAEHLGRDPGKWWTQPVD